MEEKSGGEGLGLSLTLGLGCATSTTSSSSSGSFKQDDVSRPPLLPLPSPTPSSPFPLNFAHHGIRSPWTADVFPSPPETRPSFPRGLTMFDINQNPNPPTPGGDPCHHNQHQVVEDDGGVSSPNSTVSSVSGKRSEAAAAAVAAGEDVDTEGERTSCSHGGSDDDEDDEDGGGGGDAAGRKKLRLSKEQAVVLEETFKEHTTLNPKQKVALAKELNLRPRQVEVWFQNRRARTKLKQTEVDCEYLKSCCDKLTEENRRLHKEVQELRALKLSPNFYMQHMNPPTTLTMCPSCERVAAVSSSSSSSSPSSTSAATTAAAASTTTTTTTTSVNHQLPLSISPWAAIPVPHHHRPFP